MGSKVSECCLTLTLGIWLDPGSARFNVIRGKLRLMAIHIGPGVKATKAFFFAQRASISLGTLQFGFYLVDGRYASPESWICP